MRNPEKLLNEKYRELAQKTNLNGLLRAVFSPISSIEECDSLLEKAEMVRQEIKQIQSELIKAFATNEITKTVPLRLLRDSRSAASTPYLRWRNYQSEVQGDKGFYAMLQNLSQDKLLYSSLLQTEKVRIGLNMQIAVIHNIVSQLQKMRGSMGQVEKMQENTP